MPQILRRDTDDGGIISVWEITESPQELMEKLSLSKNDLINLQSFKLDFRKLEFLAVRCLIKEILGIDPNIQYLPSGKPLLKNSTYNLSISHTKGYAAIALSKHEMVGIDIEYPSERVNNIYSRFISSDEEKFIPHDKKTQYYTLIWSLKETMYKIFDEQSIIFNRHLICTPFKIQQEGIIEATFCKENTIKLVYNYMVNHGFYLVYHC